MPPPPMGVEVAEVEHEIQHCPASENPFEIEVASTCCSIVDPNEVHPCNCEPIEVPSSEERSSSYNSCTLPLKPLKVVTTDMVTMQQQNLPSLSSSQGILKKSNNFTLPRNMYNMEVMPFDQMPPCDDCLQRARKHGSFGDICHNLEAEECGFHLQQQRTTSSTSSKDRGCSKHGSSSSNKNFIVVSRRNSYECYEKEEVEAVESSV